MKPSPRRTIRRFPIKPSDAHKVAPPDMRPIVRSVTFDDEHTPYVDVSKAEEICNLIGGRKSPDELVKSPDELVKVAARIRRDGVPGVIRALRFTGIEVKVERHNTGEITLSRTCPRRISKKLAASLRRRPLEGVVS